ncbi:TPA: DUF1799 domain-containing protein [Neisseria meningitidis]|uniref:DUF1799 domain-containing protein n=1 Tax=Neisseria meningitidis TaxID=487 RepID=UPI000E572FB7|nr:DUF1799 domain-containing protein [Neisseria meningitidis]MBW3887972.1 DUF1799 domain-containing protein [Neisseria meningitidis]MBW3907106.1 DUF1799 domain-containing protein [Neisseria meningitidis]MBW3924363.1 DUF1799 domain-containing protein [Neisseria meningitidis]MBW3934992.1 DUF1799 domain-containing protein [Neisseria meningitidis]
MNVFGFSADDFSEEETTFGVWPCNWQAVQLFIGVSTQWRIGMSGATGLDYSAVAAVMECGNIKSKKRKALLEKVRLMELEVLSMWAGEHE